jgi:hypothetical protein
MALSEVEGRKRGTNMKKILYLAACFSLLTLPAYAGHGTIRETETEIIIEYSGDEDDKQAAIIIREEREKQEAAVVQKIEQKKQVKEKRAANRAANRANEED